MLDQANDPAHPLLERVKFLSITGSNLDEFFMVRVATLLKKFRAGIDDLSPDGLHTAPLLAAIRQRASQMLDDMATCWQELLRTQLESEGVRFLEPADHTPDVRAYLASYFKSHIWPVLTPLAFDPGHPFPHISNLSHNFAVVVRHSGRTKFARVKVPDQLPRFIPLPERLVDGGRPCQAFVFIEDVIKANIQELFPGTQVRSAHLFRIVRDTDMVIQEDEADDLLETVDRSLRKLRYGALSLLQVEASMPRRVLDILAENFEVDEDVILRTSDRLGFADWMELLAIHRPALKDPPFVARHLWPGQDAEAIFDEIRYQDWIVHHPFESFASVEQFLRAAVKDPHVVAIKMTLYRIGQNSPLIDLLIEAAEAGKQVAVLVELKARFDERNNIIWANRLEEAGIHVVYGLVNLKTHCKLCLVVRQEADGIRRYAHIGTGNYNAGDVEGLHRHRPVHRVAGSPRRCVGGVQLPDRLLEPEVLQGAAGGAGQPADRHPRADRSRDRAREGGAAGAADFQEQRDHGPGEDPRAVCRVAGRRADRSHRPRRLLPAAGRARRQHHDHRALDRRPVPGALAHLLLRKRRVARGLHRQRRPDGAQPGSPRGSALPGH